MQILFPTTMSRIGVHAWQRYISPWYQTRSTFLSIWVQLASMCCLRYAILEYIGEGPYYKACRLWIMSWHTFTTSVHRIHCHQMVPSPGMPNSRRTIWGTHGCVGCRMCTIRNHHQKPTISRCKWSRPVSKNTHNNGSTQWEAFEEDGGQY